MTESLETTARRIGKAFREERVKLTLGGEPTYVPFVPDGAEWNTTAMGPAKLDYAWRLAEHLVASKLPHALCAFTPGKSYPGERNPRWTLQLFWRRDGRRMITAPGQRFKTPDEEGPPVSAGRIGILRKALARRLNLRGGWLKANDPMNSAADVWVLPLDYKRRRWVASKWLPGGGKEIELLRAEGPAGLRLPLHIVPDGVERRAFVIEAAADGVNVFIPPFVQNTFETFLRHLSAALREARLPYRLQGYVPDDAGTRWEKLSLAPDPGVLEVNLPACAGWKEYDAWIQLLDTAAASVGLCPYKCTAAGEYTGTGGGNHLLFGGPALERNPFFTRPGWVTSILRYWQKHPALSYVFTGHYVGPSSQAPRPDESARPLYDLEMAYRFLESLEPGDHRYLISETLRHLHTDGGGNTHRSEISVDKFWSVNWTGGCRGLIEFRALETLPRTDWTSAVALLWLALAAHLLRRPCRTPLIEYQQRLHDRYFLPSVLWADLKAVLGDLRRGGFEMPEAAFREIWEWRFPVMLEFAEGKARCVVRKAHEGWPLLCETPIEGGTTSRFVDSSIERIEFAVNEAFARDYRVFVAGRELPMETLVRDVKGAGLRYRRSRLYPSLHPGIEPHMPLRLTFQNGGGSREFALHEDRRHFEPATRKSRIRKRPCQTLQPGLITYDLRLT